ncbi:MAG: polysaccharide biosynthesis C-terminal domain-containing protein [Deltaproteobacteria bacterium]|nr:polysaccharide biosynthesis C-terminal domain-containing protein [Deltaproteobacteria bacterium]
MAGADTKTLVRGAGVMLPATLLGNALLLGLDTYLNGVLPLAEYGMYGAVKRLLQILGFVGLLGMENAVIRVVARAPGAVSAQAGLRTALVASLATSTLLALGLYALADLVAAWVDDAPGTATALRLGALSLPFAAVRLLAVAAAQGWGTLVPRAVVTFLAWPVLQFLGFFALARAYGDTGIAAVGGYTLAMAIGAGHAWWSLGRVRPPATGGEAGEGSLAGMFAVAWPLWAQGMGMALYTWADQVVLAGLRGAEAAGTYGPVATIAPLFGLGLGALNSAFAPVIARKHAEGDKEGLQAMYRLVTRWAVLLAVPPAAVALVAPMTALAPWPNASAEAATALRVTALAQLACTAVGSVNYLLIMCGRQRDTLYNAVPAVLINLSLSVLLVPRLGVTGAALANGAAMAVANIAGLVQVWRHLHIHPFGPGLLRALLAGLAPAAVAYLAPGGWLGVGIVAVVGGAAFVAAAWALGLDEFDRLLVDTFRKRFRA